MKKTEKTNIQEPLVVSDNTKSNKKSILILGAILALFGCSGFYYYEKTRQSEAITLYGNIDIRQVNMAFRVDGRLQKMNFDEGDVVQKGDVLAHIDDEPLLNKLNQAKAQLDQAKVQSKNATITFDRKQPLCRSGTISKQECDDVATAKDESLANVAYELAMVAEAQTAANDATLTAPEPGVILVRITEPGSMLKAGLPVYTISLNDKMWARAYIKETELGKIKLGTKVNVHTDSNDKVYKGHVGFISPQAEFTPKNIETASLRTDLVYRARIIIDNPDDFLKQGMPITIKITDND